MLRSYPPGWRARYGDELDLLTGDLSAGGRRPIPMAADLLRGAAAAWLSERRKQVSEHSRGQLITVLWSWVTFAAVAAWFGHDLGQYPNAGAAQQLTREHPGVITAYHALLAAGIVGVAATGAAAFVFGIGAARDARANRRPRTYALMVVPPVIAVAWILGVRLIFAELAGTAGLIIGVGWLLAGLSGIAVATLAVSKIIKSCTFSELTWQIGGVAAIIVTMAMMVATAATLVWGLVILTGWAPAHPGTDAVGWLTVTAIMVVATGRAAIALISSLRPPATADRGVRMPA